MQPIFISVSEFAGMFSIGRTKAYELIGANAVQSKMIGRRRLILLESAQKFASESFIEATPASRSDADAPIAKRGG